MRNTFFFLVLFSFSSTCLASEKETVIHLKTKNASIKEIRVFWGDLMGNMNIIAKAPINANGETTLIFDIENPYFAFIDLGIVNQKVYLKPNGTYTILLDFSKEYFDIRFEGTDANLNNYLESQKQTFRNFKYLNKEYYDWNIHEFSAGIAKVDSILLMKQNTFFSSHSISDDDKELIKNLELSDILSIKLNRYLSDYAQTDSLSVPPNLQNLESCVVFDEKMLLSKSESYQLLLKLYYFVTTSSNKKVCTKESSSLEEYLYCSLQKNYTAIEKYPIPIACKEFILADFLMNILRQKAPQNFEVFFAKFKDNYPNSYYIPLLQNQLNTLFKLQEGKYAPEIRGLTRDKKTVQLSDFKEKIVYVDFWATWCGPCIKEIPFATKLQKKFENNPNIVFLFVSIDSDKEKWKTYLSKNVDFTGTHINIDEANMADIKRNYAIAGVPRYIIIGQDGRIIDPNAERPSSEKIEQTLQELATKK